MKQEETPIYVNEVTKKRFCAAAMARGMSDDFLLQECLKTLESEESQAVRKSRKYYEYIAGID